MKFLTKGSDTVIRGTTASFKFKLPYKRSHLQWVNIKFWQDGNAGSPAGSLPITKTLAHCFYSSDPYELYIVLLPTETIQFSDKTKAKVQLGAQAIDGTIFASRETLISVYPINDEILDGEGGSGSPLPPDIDGDGLIILDGSVIMQQGW